MWVPASLSQTGIPIQSQCASHPKLEGRGHRALIFRNITFLYIIYLSRLKLKHIFIEGKTISLFLKTCTYKVPQGFPGSSVVMNSPANARDTGDMDSTSGSERSPRIGNGNPVQYSCLGNSMDRGAWWATVHGVTKSMTKHETQKN